MNLASDLLEQSRHLGTRERGRPRQASLRRSISAAYYAVFHLLVEDGTKRLASGISTPGARRIVARGFDHREMAEACRQFQAQQLAGRLASHFGSLSIPQELRRVADGFVELQQARHAADYDVSVRFSRHETLMYVKLASQLFADWKVVRELPSGKALLIALFMLRKVRS